MREMDVVGVRVEMPLHAPMLLLRETRGGRHLPIWIGATEASAIVNALDGTEPERPLTHDLFCQVVEMLGHVIREVRIVDVADGVFFATLRVDDLEIECRPSDGVALAVRLGVPILCDEKVLDEAGVTVPGDADAEVEAFREFLEQVDVDDFRPGP